MKLFTDQVGRLTINLGAIKRNWQYIRDNVEASVVVSAVVKANAYGLGVDRVAPALYEQGCRDFYVASLAEGIQLRDVLPEGAAIYLLAGVAAGDESFCEEYDLIPVLSSLAAIESWLQFCLSQKRSLPTVVKFDSGMSRLGLALEDLVELLSADQLDALGVVGFMSHLACADECFNKSNSQQLKYFYEAARLLRAKIPMVRLSLANSSGIFLGENYHFNSVRPGAALYGINPCPGKENPMQSVVGLKLPILQLKNLKCESSVGYGGDAVAPSGCTLAIAQGGYADGLNRILALRPYGFIDGKAVPLLGRMSMDSCIFDVSAALHLSRGDYIDLFLDAESLSDLATNTASLGYEVLTSLGLRFQRVYLDDE